MSQLREKCGDNVYPVWVAVKTWGWIKGKSQIEGFFWRCRCSAVILANSEEQAGPSGPVCWMQVAEILSRQHVSKHALSLSTLLSDPWQIDREAAAPPHLPAPCTLLTRLVPTQMWTQLMSAAASWLRLCWSQMHESADWGGISLNPQTSKPPGLSRHVSYTWVIIWGAHCCTCSRSGFGISALFLCPFSFWVLHFIFAYFFHFSVLSCFSCFFSFK